MLFRSFCGCWKEISGKEVHWRQEKQENAVHEAGYLKLDCSRMKTVFGWNTVWGKAEMLKRTVEWMYAYVCGDDVKAVMNRQIGEYAGCGKLT